MTTRSFEPDATLDVPLSPGRMASVLLFFAIFAAVSVCMAFDPEGGRRSPEANYVMGWLGGLLFGSFIVLLLWQFVTLRGPVVTLSPEGLYDRRYSPDLIPWSAVDSLSVRVVNRFASVLVVRLKPGQGAKLTQTTRARLMSYLNFPSPRRPDDLTVPTLTLATRLDELQAVATDYFERYAKQAEGALQRTVPR